MRKIFCRDVRNAQMFLDGIQQLKERGAVEASWMLLEAEPGQGKSNTLEWYSVQHDAPLVRCKAGWSVPWALRDIALALELEPKHSAKANFDLILSELVMRETILMVDEINHAAKTLKVLETLRDLTDMSQTMLIAGGHKGTAMTLKAHKQIYSRITKFVEFGSADAADITAVYAQMSEVPVSECAVTEILRQTGGHYREVMNTIVRIEQMGRRHKGQPVTAAIIGEKRLTNDGQVRGLRGVK